MKAWQIAVVAAIVLAAGALTAVAIAAGVDRDGWSDGGSMMAAAGNGYGQSQNDQGDPQRQNGQGWGQQGGQGGGMMGPDGGMMGPGSGVQGSGSQLTNEQRQQAQDLMQEHRADMQTWWQKFGDDPQSAVARKALQELRAEHAQEMQDLFNELGIQGVGRGMWRNGNGTGGGSDAPCANGDGTTCPGCGQGQDGGSQPGSGYNPSTSTPGFSY